LIAIQHLTIGFTSFDKAAKFWGHETKNDYGQESAMYRCNDPFLTTPLPTETDFHDKYFNPRIIVDPNFISELSAPEMEWAILHEKGHLTKPAIPDLIETQLSTVQAYVLAFWGAHKSKPYKNVFTKYPSKAIAFLALPALFKVAAYRSEEKRADRWANAHADEQALKGGISIFENWIKPKHQEICKDLNLPLSVGQHLIDPIHPSSDSRIAKIKTALKARFGVDA
jgi:hypothetical protein